MPIYVYACVGCGVRFEKRRNIEDRDDAIKCPHCGTENIDPVRVVTNFTFTGLEEEIIIAANSRQD